MLKLLLFTQVVSQVVSAPVDKDTDFLLLYKKSI
jgi:hypothetical protein